MTKQEGGWVIIGRLRRRKSKRRWKPAKGYMHEEGVGPSVLQGFVGDTFLRRSRDYGYLIVLSRLCWTADGM